MPDLDVEEMRAYLNWLSDRLLADELAELEHDAFCRGSRTDPTATRTQEERRFGLARKGERLYVRTSIAVVRRRLTERDCGLLDSLGQLTLRTTLAELRRDYPRQGNEDQAWLAFLADHPEIR